MNRAERRRQARQQEKSQLPLNPTLTLARIAGMTGQDVSYPSDLPKEDGAGDHRDCNRCSNPGSPGEVRAGRRLYYSGKHHYFHIRH